MYLLRFGLQRPSGSPLGKALYLAPFVSTTGDNFSNFSECVLEDKHGVFEDCNLEDLKRHKDVIAQRFDMTNDKRNRGVDLRCGIFFACLPTMQDMIEKSEEELFRPCRACGAESVDLIIADAPQERGALLKRIAERFRAQS